MTDLPIIVAQGQKQTEDETEVNKAGNLLRQHCNIYYRS